MDRSPRLGSALILVLVCSAIFAWIAAGTFHHSPERDYYLDLAGSSWIAPADPSASAFFRLRFHVGDAVRRASLQIAATDYFELYVNGVTVDKLAFGGSAPAGIYDVTRLLQTGENVLAVAVERSTHPGSPQMRLRLNYYDDREREIVSDSAWKVRSYPETPAATIPWHSIALHDSSWPEAVTVNPDDSVIEAVSVRPEVISTPLNGFWMVPNQPAASTALYSRSFDPPLRGIDAWMRIAAACPYDLMINGRVVVVAEDTSLACKAYDLTRWAGSDIHEISIRTRSVIGVPEVYADGMVGHSDGRLTTFQTDAAWRVASGVSTSVTESAPVALLRPEAARSGEPLEVQVVELDPPPLWGSGHLLRNSLLPAAALFLFLSVWWAVGKLLSRFRNLPLRDALRRDALLHAPLIPLMLIPLILGFDIRLPPNFVNQPALVYAVLATWGLLRLTHFLPPSSRATGLWVPSLSRRVIPIFVLGIIVMGGALLRFDDLSAVSIDHDEQLLIDSARGVHASGLPYTDLGYIRKQLSTYELVPYFIALSAAFFGWEEWAVRLPSAIFGVLTVLVVGLFGRRLAGWRTGLLAAAVHALLPAAIQWSKNSFWPQQAQLLSLLTCWMFWEAMQRYPFRSKYLVLGSLGCVLTYFTWEGSGFIIPAIALTLIVLRWGRWSWMFDRQLWLCLFFVGSIIILQMCYRKLTMSSYLMVGTGLSEVDTPTLFFLDPMYNARFYVDAFLLAENHFALTVVALAGLPVVYRHRGLAYAFLVGFLTLACYANFLAATSARYVHHVQPMLVLVASGVVIQWWDRIIALLNRKSDPAPLSWLGYAGCFGLVAALLIASDGVWMKTYRLSSKPERPGDAASRLGVYKFDYRGAFRFVAENLAPGDAVIAGVGNVYKYYTGQDADYFINSAWGMKVIYVDDPEVPHFIDKYAGRRVARNIEELQDLRFRSTRTWVVVGPRRSYFRTNKPVLEFLEANARVVYQSYEIRVYLLDGIPAAVSGEQGERGTDSASLAGKTAVGDYRSRSD